MRTIAVALAVCLVVAAGCGDNNPAGTDAPSGPQCSDGVDNDADGTTDFPDDLGCESSDSDTEQGVPKPQCADNRDNDGDGKIDYPQDPGCPAPQADDEFDECPDDPACPQCGDGIDNDGNGEADFPDDSMGCTSAADPIEFTDNPTACGQGMVIKPLPPTGTDTANLSGTTSMVSSPCGGGNGLPGVAYVFHINTPKVIVASTDDPMTMIDTVLDLRSSMCSTPGAELACHDDILPSGVTPNRKSQITRSLKAGTYYLIVGGKTGFDTGQYKLDVELFPGEGTPCTSVTDCGPTLECRIPGGQTAMVCIGPVCNDGIDDDADGKIDYPNDPGCAAVTDSTEADVCATMPTSPQCPACANGIDDDVDGMTDYPTDTTCPAASGANEACPQSEPVIVATMPVTSGTTVGATNDYRPPPGTYNNHGCSISLTGGPATAPDVTIQIDVPAMDRLALRLNPQFDSAQILFGPACTGAPIDCYDDPTLMAPTNLAAGRYYLVVDGWSVASGAFTLTISGNIKNGESCESPLAQSGAITCNAGYACMGTPGSRTCAPTQCNDGMDNNSDGRMDYPGDPGCQTSSDPVEDTVCPGTSCPVCSDGLDNDADMQTDYPTDTGCVSAAAPSEGCPESDAIGTITSPTTMGTLVGAVDDHDPSCVSTNFPDRVYLLTIPTTLQSLVIDTRGSVVDTVLSLMNSTCSEPSLACDNDTAGNGDSQITRASVGAGTYTIAVDALTTPLDTFVLNVRGTIVPGGSCEGALFQAGVLVCPPSFGCNGPMGSRTCTAAQCLDGQDNNGDGTTDYPNDPGCDSPSDNTEVTVCPGTSCPICSDGVDNDLDGRTDYPDDGRCTAASGQNEACIDTDAIASVLMPITTGTLVGATNDHQPGCVTGVGVDRIYSLTIPSLESLRIDTEGSAIDTVLSLMSSDCIEPALACDDDSGAGVTSLITRQFVQAGTYTIAVDALTSTTGTYNLNVQGVISPGQSCESPLVATGALRCSLGFACAGPVGMRTCALAQCIDGLDNNSDGKIDFPADPGCTSFSDGTETTVCPGTACPICSDGIDNDGDGATDYPTDPSCIAASATNEACTQSEAIPAITQRVTTGNSATAVNDYTPSCGSTTNHTSPDEALELTIPAMQSLTLAVSGFDLAHSLLDSTCGGTPIACADEPQVITRTNVAAGTYYVVIDGYSVASGPWTLTTTGVIAPGSSCEGALFQASAFTCPDGYVCAGAVGSRVCAPAACNDTTDNDGDGKNDYPNDPGCLTIGDDDETDDCFPTVGPACPACGNALDDDMDMQTDYPTDTRCPSASFFVENFCPMEANIGGEILVPTTTTTLAGAANNFATQPCQTITGNDVSFGLHLPVPVASLQIDTLGSVAADTIVSLWNVTCMAPALGCDDDSDPNGNRSLLVVSNVAAGDYAIQVDGYSSSNNTGITLNVRGTVAPGTACTTSLFASGVLVCPTGTSCTSGTCQ